MNDYIKNITEMELEDYSNSTGYDASEFEDDYARYNDLNLEPKEEKELEKNLYKDEKKSDDEELLPIEILNPKKDDWKYWR